MALAVVHDHAHVLQREACDVAGVEHAAHTLLDRRDELVGDRAAFHAVDEFEAAAAGQRLHFQEPLAELAGAAGLLLVAAVPFRARRDRLAVGNRRRAGVELELVLRRHLLEHGPEMHLAEPAHYRLVRLGVVLDAKARVFCRSEEHTSELQSQSNLVCRLLLEKKKKNKKYMICQLIDKTTHESI